jgi:hypothetical protein
MKLRLLIDYYRDAEVFCMLHRGSEHELMVRHEHDTGDMLLSRFAHHVCLLRIVGFGLGGFPRNDIASLMREVHHPLPHPLRHIGRGRAQDHDNRLHSSAPIANRDQNHATHGDGST